VPIADGLTDCQGLVHTPGLSWDTRALLRACGLSAWQFDHLVAGQGPFEPYRTELRPSPFIDLSEGFAVYRDKLSARSPKFCGNLERKERKLAREVGDLRFVADSRDESAFRALLAWKSMQYSRTGQVDIFARPWTAELMAALFTHRSGSFCGLFSVLYAGDRPVAAHFGLRGGGTLAHWFPAYDVAFGKYSAGLIMHMRMTEFTPGAGVRIIDLGTGEQRYKDELKSGEFFVGAGIASTGSLVGTAYRAGRTGGQRVVAGIKDNPALFRAAHWLRGQYRSARNARMRSRSAG
jgi:CelD/BcsL family acetyltransferase involved in cellulose biosynthesis